MAPGEPHTPSTLPMRCLDFRLFRRPFTLGIRRATSGEWMVDRERVLFGFIAPQARNLCGLGVIAGPWSMGCYTLANKPSTAAG